MRQAHRRGGGPCSRAAAADYTESMSIDFTDDEPSVVIEPVERRDAVRGPLPGMTATLPGAAEPAPVVEAGLRGVFVATGALDGFSVGDTFETVMARGEHSLVCTVEVVRKEKGRRHGMALRVVDMSAEAEKTFEAMRT
jgi:hypothetical protein